MNASPESLQSPVESHGQAVARLAQKALNQAQKQGDPSLETSDIFGDLTQIGD